MTYYLSFKKNLQELNHFPYAIWFFAAILLAGCANMTAPVGGDKDTSPPKIDSTRSTKFGITKFKAKKIVITFDEYVELFEPQKIMISPPIKRRPEFTIREKTVEIKFVDTLRENTTYNINFGEAVRDITERNVKRDLQIGFSTGDVLDSLQTQGSLVEAITNKTEAGVSILLYAENAPDSIVKKSLPLYFTTTDASGLFTVRNMKPGKYRIFALKDANNDYKYNQITESIGFNNEPITVSDKPSSVAMQLFEPEKPLQLIQQRASQFGKLDLTFSRKPTDVKLKWLDDKNPPITSIFADTLTVWHQKEGKNALLVTVPNSIKPDTVFFTGLSRSTFSNEQKLKPGKAEVPLFGKGNRKNAQAAQKPIVGALKIADLQQVIPNDTFKINFQRPLRSIDTSLIVLRDSSKMRVPLNAFLTEKLGFFGVNTPWKAGMNYSLTLLPNAVSDTYGLKNDTIIYTKIKALGAKDLGTISLKINSLDSTKQYIVNLTDATNNVVASFIIKNKKQEKFTVANKLVGSYGLMLITDDNKNGVWDTGDYFKHRQPEHQQIVAPQTLKANWELELSITPSGAGKSGKPRG